MQRKAMIWHICDVCSLEGMLDCTKADSRALSPFRPLLTNTEIAMLRHSSEQACVIYVVV